MIDALKGTPWWVYALFIYLVVVGVKTIKPQVASLKKIFILPLIFIVWSLSGLGGKLSLGLDLSVWIPSFILGILVGWGLTRSLKIKADKKKALIRVPGGLLTLVLILVVFGVKYYFGYTYATDPGASTNFNIVAADLISSGIITGMFFGRLFCYLSKWRNSPHQDL